MNSRSLTTALSLIAVASMLAAGRSMAIPPPTPMNFTFTHSAFSFDDTTSLLEFDYSFSERGLTYVRNGAEEIGKLYLRLTVWDSAGSKKLLMSEWVARNPKPGPEMEDRAIESAKMLALRPGKYRAQIYYEDMADASRRDSASFDMTVRSFTGKQLVLSDAELINDASPSEEKDHPFYKSGRLVFPNVAGVIAAPFLVLNSYVEVYNAHQAPTSEYDIAYRLADGTGKVFYELDERRARPKGNAIVEMKSIDVSERPSGRYFLMITAYNGLQRAATDSSTVVREFEIVNPEQDSIVAQGKAATPAPAGAVDPMLAGMNEAELDEEYQKVKPIAVPQEKEIWNKLSGTEAKGRFLTDFWLRRDPTPGDAKNENLEDYRKLLETATSLYSSAMNPKGWDSDRGRVLLQYGKPDATDRHYNDYNRKPYEVWTYVTNRYEFVFVDRTRTGTFKLVHSTAPGERVYDNWIRDFATIDVSFERGR